MNRPTTVAELMARPSTCFEPSDPPALTERRVTQDEFNSHALASGANIVIGDGEAFVDAGDVRYVTLLDEVTA